MEHGHAYVSDQNTMEIGPSYQVKPTFDWGKENE